MTDRRATTRWLPLLFLLILCGGTNPLVGHLRRKCAFSYILANGYRQSRSTLATWKQKKAYIKRFNNWIHVSGPSVETMRMQSYRSNATGLGTDYSPAGIEEAKTEYELFKSIRGIFNRSP